VRVKLPVGGGKRFDTGVHRLVLQAHHGRGPEGALACHNDGNPANNAISNLRWDTNVGNLADKWEHGTRYAGTRHLSAKLTPAEVAEIKRRYAAGVSQNSMAKHYGVARSTIWQVCHDKTWQEG